MYLHKFVFQANQYTTDSSLKGRARVLRNIHLLCRGCRCLLRSTTELGPSVNLQTVHETVKHVFILILLTIHIVLTNIRKYNVSYQIVSKRNSALCKLLTCISRTDVSLILCMTIIFQGIYGNM